MMDSDDDDDVPSGLPEPEKQKNENPLDKARFCPKCGKEGRIVSNYLGVNVYCNPCKNVWAISAPLNPVTISPANIPRGLSKITLVEPDYNMADDVPNEVNPYGKVKHGKS